MSSPKSTQLIQYKHKTFNLSTGWDVRELLDSKLSDVKNIN